MDVDARQAVVTALVSLAASPHYLDRAAAGRCLASFADVPAARDALLPLVLDTADTFVTLATTEALLRRGDAVGLTIVCAGASVAENERLDWIYTAVQSVLGVFERDRDDAVRICRGLADDPAQEVPVRSGATRLIARLTDLQPVLITAQTA